MLDSSKSSRMLMLVITKTKKADHITPVLRTLHWLPVYQIIEFKILLIVYKALNGFGPN